MNTTRTITNGAHGEGVSAGFSASVMMEVEPPPARSQSGMAEQGTGAAAKSGKIPPSQANVGGRSAKHRLVQVLVGVLALGLSVYLSARYAAYARCWVSTDNAYLTAHIHSISSRVAGTAQEVLVEENQTVEAGAVLARLDRRDFEVRRQQALAQLAQAKAQFQDAQARISQARAQIAREQARAIKAENDLARARSLYEGGSGAISKQEFDLAQAEADAAKASVEGAESALESANAATGAAAALQKVAQASLQDADLQLSYTEIVAPVAGRIGKRNLEIGNRVQPGQALLALVQTDVWVNANFKETQLAHLKPGQPVEVRVDAFPRTVVRGTVESLAPGSGAQFALLPADNATGNFTKIVQRVPVKIVLDRVSLGELFGHLIPGMSAVVEVKVR